MKTFTFTLNVEADAVDLEQALEIAKACETAVRVFTSHWKINRVEADDVEEL